MVSKIDLLEEKIESLEDLVKLNHQFGHILQDWRLWGVAFVAIAVAEWLELVL